MQWSHGRRVTVHQIATGMTDAMESWTSCDCASDSYRSD